MGPSPPAPRLARIDVSLSRNAIEIGETVTAAAAGFDGAGRSFATGPLSWSSSAPRIASVSSEGVVTGVAAGHSTIVALSGTIGASATITVNAAAVPPNPVVSSAFSVNVFSPTADATLDDSMRVLASVTPRQQLAKVVGTVGPRAFTLRLIPAGTAGEAWEAWVRISDLAAGTYRVVVSAYDMSGAMAADSVSFERKLLNTGGTGTGPSGHKQVKPLPPAISPP